MKTLGFRNAVLALAALDAFALVACDRVRGTVQMEDPTPPPVVTAPNPERATSLKATPASAFVDAAPDPATGTPYEQAVTYHEGGQVWLARLVLEKHALGSEAKARETELLARLCAELSDEDCIHKCEARLGRKLKLSLDGGAHAKGLPSAEPVAEENDAVKAQRLVLVGNHEGARQLLLPKLVDKKITEGELRILRAACEHERDTMCVLACDGLKKKK